jgi:hypothetical protein
MEKTLLGTRTKKIPKVRKQYAGPVVLKHDKNGKTPEQLVTEIIVADLLQPRPQAIANLLAACREL